jgi:putative protease
VDIDLSGWQEQLVLTMTCEDGVSVTHTLDGEFAEANQAEKSAGEPAGRRGEAGADDLLCPRRAGQSAGALFVPNSLLNQLRRETAECWMKRV